MEKINLKEILELKGFVFAKIDEVDNEVKHPLLPDFKLCFMMDFDGRDFMDVVNYYNSECDKQFKN